MKYLKAINEKKQDFFKLKMKCHLDYHINIEDEITFSTWKDSSDDEKTMYVKNNIQEYISDNLEMIVNKMMKDGNIKFNDD